MTLAIRVLLPVGGLAMVAMAMLPIILGAKAPTGIDRQLINWNSQPLAEDRNADVRRIVDARLPPYSAVGRFKGTMTCTAAVILHPRIIITAAHCITENDGTTKKSNLWFRPGYQAGTDLGRFEAKVWAVGSKQSFKRQSVHDASQDWVVLVLASAPKGVAPLILNHRSFETLKARKQQFMMPGYSNDVGNADVLSITPNCSIHDLVWNVLVHDCSAQPGSSGSPLLLRARLQYAVVGIHTGSMFASDGGRVAKFVGYRAIGSWMFTETLSSLIRQLNGDASQNGEAPTY